jgi:hypothetical protein
MDGIEDTSASGRAHPARSGPGVRRGEPISAEVSASKRPAVGARVRRVRHELAQREDLPVRVVGVDDEVEERLPLRAELLLFDFDLGPSPAVPLCRSIVSLTAATNSTRVPVSGAICVRRSGVSTQVRDRSLAASGRRKEGERERLSATSTRSDSTTAALTAPACATVTDVDAEPERRHCRDSVRAFESEERPACEQDLMGSSSRDGASSAMRKPR